MTPAPWDWLPDTAPWCAAVPGALSRWAPRGIDPSGVAAIVDAVARAAPGDAAWLYHPCLSGAIHREEQGAAARALSLAAWVAGHAGVDVAVVLAEPTWCWSTDGGFKLDRGRHHLAEAGRRMVEEQGAPAFPLDPWCSLLGYDHPGSFPASGLPTHDQEQGAMEATLVAFRSCALLAGRLPGVDAWLRRLAKVVIPLDRSLPGFRSSSYPSLPGVIFADLLSELQFLESLVHESAHHLLYLTEARGPLIDPAETRTFASPLRPDPRPLRGILLAYHALAFICALYAEVARSPLGRDAVDPDDLALLRQKAEESRAVLEGAAASLTDLGRDFLTRTHEVVAYAT